jgi:hypothetical protein
MGKSKLNTIKGASLMSRPHSMGLDSEADMITLARVL